MHEQTHRHAAIMFTDIVGYTALMGSDEDKAFEVLKQNQDIHKKLILQFNGTLIKEMGDGMLISFDLASEAVRCAIEIQKASKEQDIPLKIGIHEGEMVFADADVLGDAVNIASRLQDNADQGSIYISSSVHKNVKNKAGINTSFVEERTFKNVDEPVKVYKVLNEGEKAHTIPNRQKKASNKYIYYLFGVVIIVLAILLIRNYFPSSVLSEIDKEKSIAVMPFDNESADEENEYFVNGMMEDIRNNLSKIGDLRVISKTSTEKYRKTALSSQEIGRELLINYLLEGTVQKLGDQVKIHAQLISAENDDHIWEDTYLRDITDVKEVFEIQSSIAQAIANELKAVITPEEMELITAIPTENIVAYDFYLKGKDAADFTNEGMYKAMEYYNQALALDENLAEAYIGLGHVNWYLAHFSGTPPAPFWIASKNYLEKALRLDPTNADAWSHLGVVQHNWDWDSISSYQSNKKAYSLEPNNPTVIRNYGWFNMVTSNNKFAEILYERLFKIEPDSYANFYQLIFLLRQGKINEASKLNDRLVEKRVGWGDFQLVGFYYLELGQLEEAAVNFEKSSQGMELEAKPFLAYTLAKMGEKDKAIAILDQLKETAKIRYMSPYHFAVIYSGLGDYDMALNFLKQAYVERDFRLHWMESYHPKEIFEPLRANNEFQNIVSNLWN